MTGRLRSHSGGLSAGRQADTARIQSPMTSTLTKMVPMASTSGTTNSSSSASDITSTATQRLPPAQACTRSISGQVATTTIVAQMVGPRKGRRIHSEPPISSPMKSTAKVVRVRSERRAGGGSMGMRRTLSDRQGRTARPGGRRQRIVKAPSSPVTPPQGEKPVVVLLP